MQDHFSGFKRLNQVYGWTLMNSLFSELFSKQDWLKVWDHLISNPPAFMYHFIVAYLVHFRKPLMGITDANDFYYFFQRRNPTSVAKIIQKAYSIQSNTPKALDPASHIQAFKPCNVGEYPIFNQYPQFIVNYQSRMKTKIRQEEDDYIKKRHLAAELSRLTDELRKEKKQWENSDWQMNEMIEKWWVQMTENEEERAKFKARMNFFEAEKKIDVMSQISQARKSFMSHHSNNAKDHIDQVERVVGQNERAKGIAEMEVETEKQLEGIENEWQIRKDEMLRTRKEISNMQKARARRY
jgi:hypothetical protein